MDVVFARNGDAVGAVIGNLLVVRHGFVLRDVVGQHQRVLALVVFEPEVNAFVFHQAADEGVVGFLVLHAVFPIAIRLRQLELDGVAVVLEHLADHVGHVLVLEDLVVRRLRQVPEPRPHRGAVDGVARRVVLAAHQHAAGDVSAEIARCARRGLDLERQRFAKQRFHVQRIRLRDQLDFKFK
ncbi:hypothetical protein D3C72_1119200 [compost metagenome]